MLKTRASEKGVALLIVLATILVVAILANIILSLILSQYRLTHHQASRIQAHYVAQAGMNYALDQLRIGNWIYAPPVNSCPHPSGCLINDSDFQKSIRSFDGSNNKQFRVIFCPSGSLCGDIFTPCNPPTGNNFCIYVTAKYTYTEP